MDGPDNGIILYHYSFSPYARRVIWYLQLRGIKYAECKQPPVMPRPDVALVGVNYRRIPLMAIGKDVYCDTRLILQKLEQLFPDGALSASDPDQEAIQRLLSMWTIDGGVFLRASQLIPTSMPLLNDPKFVSDREDFSGRSWSKERIEANRPEALVQIKSHFTFLETTLLADGRDWILKTAKPSLADIEAIWPFDWLNGLKDALPSEIVSAQKFPRVYAWIARFNKELKATKMSAPKPTTLKGKQALERMLSSKYVDDKLTVQSDDPLGLKQGELVEVSPIDSGFRYKDAGPLLGLTDDEVVIGVKAEGGEEIRLHAPRMFRIQAVKAKSSAKL